MSTVVLAVYIVLLVAGGVVGFVKAQSRVSLFTSLAFGAALAVCGFAPVPHGLAAAKVLQALLLAVFLMRWKKTGKFMPAGLMTVVTFAALALEFVVG